MYPRFFIFPSGGIIKFVNPTETYWYHDGGWIPTVSSWVERECENARGTREISQEELALML